MSQSAKPTRTGSGVAEAAVLLPLDPPAAADEADQPHYHGHRDRLRTRFLTSGAGALQDYELLELLLFAAHPHSRCSLMRMGDWMRI